MRLGAFRQPFEQRRRGDQNFRRILLMKMSPFPLTGISSFSALCVLHNPSFLWTSHSVTGLVKLGENWKVGRDGNRSALVEQAAGDGHSPSWVPPSVTYFWGQGWQLYCCFCCFPFQTKGSAWTIFVPSVFPSQWEAHEIAAVTSHCCSGSCIKGHCCCLHDVQGE